MSDVIELTGPALARAVLDRRAATCGTCNRSWDDTVSTSVTPAPSGRCPFEYEHDAKPEPLQYHYVVWAEETDNGIVWSIDLDSSLLDGNVYDPKLGWSDGWRTLDDEEEEISSRIFTELENRLNVK
jgi:hypothetical protein